MTDEQVIPSPDVHFEPIIKLPLVEIKSLEENEEILFEMRARLFRFDTSNEENSEWKERGTGVIKILKQKEDDIVRILMRRDKTFKICANHYILPYMELKPNTTSDRAWIWTTAADFADEEQKTELLAIKFGDAEKAQKFKAAFEEAKKIASLRQVETSQNRESTTNSASENESDDEDKVSKDAEKILSKNDAETKSSSVDARESEVVTKLEDLSLKKDEEEEKTELSDSSKTVK